MKTKMMICWLIMSQLLLQSTLFAQRHSCLLEYHGEELPLVSASTTSADCCDPPLGGTTDPPIKFVNVNLHFLLSESANNPGNFSEDDGYTFAENVVNNMNDNWKKNYEMLLYLDMDTDPNASPPDYPPKRLQVLLKGVYFDRNQSLFDDAQQTTSATWGGSGALLSSLGQNGDTEFNLFFVETPNVGGSGVASNFSGQPYAAIYDAFSIYQSSPNSYPFAKTANHELAHMLGLTYHAFQCANPCNDIDIYSPKESQPLANNPTACLPTPIGNWSASNNLMNYSQLAHALTPCQIDYMHQTLENYYCDYVGHCQYIYTTTPISCCPDKGIIPGIRVDDLCHPPTAFFELDPEVLGCDDEAVEVWLDGRGSWKEDRFKIKIEPLFPAGGPVDNSTFFGEVGILDLTTYYNFQIGGFYRVTLTVYNDCEEDEQVAFLTVADKRCSAGCMELYNVPCQEEEGGGKEKREGSFLCSSCWVIGGLPFNENCTRWDVEIIYNGQLYSASQAINKSVLQLSYPCGSDINICIELCGRPEPCDQLQKCFSFKNVNLQQEEGEDRSVRNSTPLEFGSVKDSEARPNPFSDQTTLHFDLLKAGTVTFEVFDVRGVVWYRETNYYEAGANQVRLAQLPEGAQGILLYRVMMGDQVCGSGRMLRLNEH